MKLWQDRRGVSALEFAMIGSVMATLVVPITDIGIATVTYISAYQSLRSVGAYALYNPPSDVTDSTILANYLSGKLPATTKVMTNTITNTTVSVCAGNTNITPTSCVAPTTASPPLSFLFKTTVTLNPIIFPLGCKSPTGCQITYVEQFQ